MKLAFLAVVAAYVGFLFLVGASLRSPGMPYLVTFSIGALAIGIGVGWILLHERRG